MSGGKARRNRGKRLQAVGQAVRAATDQYDVIDVDSALGKAHQRCKQVTGPMARTLDELRAAPRFEK